VAVIGLGYVGIPTAATLAHLGHDVVCGDRDAERIGLLADGVSPIFEEGLEELLAEGQRAGRLRFVVGAAEAAAGAEFVFLCVPTPQGPDGAADLSYVQAVAAEIAPVLDAGCVVVNKSTVPVGSTRVVERVLRRPDVSVVSNPEFLREGTAVADSLSPERIVVGGDDPAAAARVGELFSGTDAPLLVTDAATAETIKYAANAFLATKLSFINAISGLCEAVGADVRDVILGLGYDRRIGFEFLTPGPGWGGSCLPKDTRALVAIADAAGYDFSLLEGAIAANEQQLSAVVAKVARLVADGHAPTSFDHQATPVSPPTRTPGGRVTGGRAAAAGDLDALRGSRIAVWGLTFKAGTDDLRNSPAVEIVRRLAAAGAEVRAYDPMVPVPDGGPVASAEVLSNLADAPGGGTPLPAEVTIHADAYGACKGADALVVLTEWDDFRWMDFVEVRSALAAPTIVDGRNLLDPAHLRRLGFAYSGIGRR